MWPITMLNHTNKQINIPGTEKCLFFYLFWAPYARTTRYEEAYLPEGKKRPRSLRSLGLASLKPSQSTNQRDKINHAIDSSQSSW